MFIALDVKPSEYKYSNDVLLKYSEFEINRPTTPSTPHHQKRLPVLSLIPEDVSSKPPAYQLPAEDADQRSRSHNVIPLPTMGSNDMRDFRRQLDLSSDSDSAKSHPGWSRV